MNYLDGNQYRKPNWREQYTDSLFADGFDDAILGADFNERMIYSVQQMLDILHLRDQMTYEDALEYFEFNIRSANMGDKTPIWCYDFI